MEQPQPETSAKVPPTPEEQAMLYCPVCSQKLEARKCKMLCRRCGYYLSCADYY